MKASQRLGRWGLVLLLGGTAGGFGLMTPAHADESSPDTVSVDSGSSGAAANCVNSFVSRGRAVVAGPSYEIPFRSVGGGPYVENEVSSRPATFSFASDAYEGWIGDVVLGTSGAYPKNVTSAVAHYPPAPNGGSTTDIQFGPFARTQAKAQPWNSVAKAQAFGHDESSGGVIGPSTALTNSAFDGKVLKGVDEIIGYDLKLGPVLVKQMHSVLKYETDGTQEGTKANWALEFSGVGGDSSKVYTITPDGFAPQGGSAQPGSGGMKQFNDGSKAFADALEKAGVARPEMKIAPAKIEVRGPGELYVSVAGLELRNAIVGAHNTTGHAQGWVFGYNERYLKMELGSCDADISNDKPADENAPTKLQEYGPFRFPDPNPQGYGGPKSTTPVPAPAAAPAAVVSKTVSAVTQRPAPTPVASTEPTIGARPSNSSWAHGVS
ncbi:MAG TPA: hypothetical protein VGO87_10765 [Acidimicrobiia bacterium]|jgi:hypothetical protein